LSETAACRLTRQCIENTCCTVFRTSCREFLLKHDTPDIAGLIAPRALHLNLGELDGGSPIDEARRGIEVIAKAYSGADAAASFSHYIADGSGHILSDEMWSRTKKWFSRHLL
jgi:hypothetical protein